MNQYFMVPFNPQGYDPESWNLDTTNLTLNTQLRLKHSYFLSGTFSAVLLNGTPLTVSETKGTADLLLIDYNATLSQLCGAKVFGKVVLNSARVTNTLIATVASYVVDIIDPSQLGQNLNPTSDVKHNSVTTDAKGVNNLPIIEAVDVTISPDGTLTFPDGGTFTKGKLLIKATDIEFPSVSISAGLWKFLGSAIKIANDVNFLMFDPTNQAWYMQNQGTNAVAPIVAFYEDNPPIGGIPIIAGNNNRMLSFVPWFNLNFDTETLNVPDVQAKTVEVGQLTTNEINIGNYTLTCDNNGVLSIGGGIKIYPNGDIHVGAITVNSQFFGTIQGLLADVSNLKAKVGGF